MSAQRFAGVAKLLAGLVALLLVGSIVLAVTQRESKNTLTADFPQVNSLYRGSAVKVLGVPVGKVEKLEPRGDVVRVTISYDDDVKLPEDVKAVVVSPAIVGDRFVQLAPAYDGGAALRSGANLPVSRTQVPVELDTIYQSLDDLAVALGPDGANSNGALSKLVDGVAGQLDGQGAKLNKTITDFSTLSTTLSNNSDALFGSMTQVNDFVSLLRENDASVRSFNTSTAQLSRVLDGEREDLAKSLRLLSLALVDVNKLITDNRGELRDNVKNLRTISQVLADRRAGLKEVSTSAPTALVNVALAYNPRAGTLDTHTNLLELIGGVAADPITVLCQLAGQEPDSALCRALGGMFPDGRGLTSALGFNPGGNGRPAAASSEPADQGSKTPASQPRNDLIDLMGVR